MGFVDARIGHFQMETFSGGGVYKLSSHYDKDTKSGPGGRGTLPPIELFFFQLCLRNIQCEGGEYVGMKYYIIHLSSLLRKSPYNLSVGKV